MAVLTSVLERLRRSAVLKVKPNTRGFQMADGDPKLTLEQKQKHQVHSITSNRGDLETCTSMDLSESKETSVSTDLNSFSATM